MPVKPEQDPGAADTSSGCEENSVEMEQSDNSYSETTGGTMDADEVDMSSGSKGYTSQECESADALLQLHTTVAKEQVEDAKTSKLNRLLKENIVLTKKIQDLEARCKRLQSQSFSVDTVHESTFKFYTGFTSRDQFDALFQHLKVNAEKMVYWTPQDNKLQEPQGGYPDRQLSKRDEMFMVLYRLRTGVCAKEVARLFGISESSLSRIFAAG
ncbi:hypothetical protein MTO96_028609 [Rhipicephalus appendiculatus]